MNWTQPLCEACWVKKYSVIPGMSNGRRATLLRLPHRVVLPDETPLEICAYCGALTFVGIYIRAHPATVPYPSDDDVEGIEPD